MPALDIKKQLDTAIWTVLELNTAFTTLVPVGQRMKAYVDAEPKKRILRGVGDYPNVKVEVGNGTLGVNAGKVFGENDTAFTSATVDTIIPQTQIATIIITYDKEDLDNQTPLESAVRAALMSKFPKLGISDVTGFTISETRVKDQAGLPTCRIQLTVTRRSKHSTLV